MKIRMTCKGKDLVSEVDNLVATVERFSSWASRKGWDGICVTCQHDWVNDCHGDCTCLSCNAERQAEEEAK